MAEAPENPPLVSRAIVLAAHPDDEVLGCGFFLQRVAKPTIFMATDGAPLDDFFWQSYGTRAAYAELRRREALAVSQTLNADLVWAGVTDMQLVDRMHEVIESLASTVYRAEPEVIITHAYEGGHPDHDACAFIAAQIGRDSRIPVWEMPLYHRTGNAQVKQDFVNRNGTEWQTLPTRHEVQTKLNMLAMYASQAEMLKEFDPHIERLRPQPAYDFFQPPHDGETNYEAWKWPVTAQKVCDSFKSTMGQ